MSNHEDDALGRERTHRIAELIKGAARLESRSHSLILEADALRKLAAKLENVVAAQQYARREVQDMQLGEYDN